VAHANVTPARDAERVGRLLDLPEVAALVATLDRLRWTGRRGYPTRAMVGMCLVKSLYAIPVWTRVVALVRDHAALRELLGCAPTEWACYRFARKLRQHNALLQACLDAVLAGLRDATPGMGDVLAGDGSDLPAYANGQRRLTKNGPLRERYADPDASWGHRSAVGTRKGGGFYGYKVHAIIDTATELPVAWHVATARDAEQPYVPALLDRTLARGFRPSVVTFDKGYDGHAVYDAVTARGASPVIPLIRTARVQRGEHRDPECQHGTWTFAGRDDKRRATKWRCPTGECQPGSLRLPYDRLHTAIPRNSARWGDLYRKRTAVERGFGRLKDEWAMLPLRVRRIERVRLHVDLTMLTMLAAALDARRRPAVAA
jgi:hypothetical protein